MAASDSAWRLIQVFLREVQPYQDILTILGVLYGSKIVIKLTWNIYNGMKTFVWPLIAPEINLVRTYGSWAVVTGSTDGIGKEYARELARRRVNIILVSRNMEKLLQTAKEIENEFNVETHLIQVDFSDGKDIYPHISKHLGDKEVGILVNNVGIMITPPSQFGNLSEKEIWDYVNVNMASTVMMTRLILPQMLSRRKGAIINISSCAAINPLPLLNVYSATKSFIEYFSDALAFEYRKNGITVQTLMPSYVATPLVGYSRLLSSGNLLVPKPNDFVRSAVRTLGRSGHTTGYWSHGIQYFLFNSIPRWLYMRGGAVIHRFLARH